VLRKFGHVPDDLSALQAPRGNLDRFRLRSERSCGVTLRRYPCSRSVEFVSAVTDQELVLATLRQVGLIIAEHLETASSDADEVVAQLVAVLDTQELADAISRMERGYGLRIVK
jgi:hypothetical protein